jgi:hypothetical protein
MTTSSISILAGSAFVAITMSMSADPVWAQSCSDSAAVRKGSWVLDVSYRRGATAAHELEYVTTRVEHMAGAGDIALVTGRAALKDGTSNTVFFAEKVPAVLSCDDVNQDGLAGISVLQFSLRDNRSGAVVPVAVIPHDGELDRAGEEPATIVIGGLAVTTSIRVSEWVFGTERPGDQIGPSSL